MAINRWTEAETKRALYLYFQLPFGQLHSGKPEIIELANAFGRTPSSIAMKLANFASLDPKITETGRKGLIGATALDRKIWAEFNDDWTRLVAGAESLSSSDVPDSNKVKSPVQPFIHRDFAGETTTQASYDRRIGQDFFRRAVLANYDNKCCVTGISEARLLNASHILPWSADLKNRHNPKNGLCLSATFDRAFDRGLMSVGDDGLVRFAASLLESSDAETRSFFGPYNARPLVEAVRFDPEPLFLKWHYDNCFKNICLMQDNIQLDATKFSYLYRDGSNFKLYGRIFLNGNLSLQN